MDIIWRVGGGVNEDKRDRDRSRDGKKSARAD